MLCRRPHACHVRILNVERIGERIDRHESQSMPIPFHSLRLLLTALDLAHTTRCRPGRAKPSGLVLWDSSSVELGRPASSLPQMGCSSSLPDRNAGRLDGLNSENSMATDSKNIRVKLVLLGDSGVGKSCIVLRFVRGQFDPTSKVTVGASFLSQTLALEDSTIVKFEIWDTAGQERYASLAPLYYRGAAVAVVVYDITSQETFKKAQYWVKELQKHASPGIIMALVGNKGDLHEKRAVSSQDAMEYAEKNGMFFIETSAKTANNINQLFQEIAKRLPRASS